MTLRLVATELVNERAPVRQPDPYADRPDIGPDIRMAGAALVSLAKALDRGIDRGATYESLKLSIAAGRHILRDLPDLVAALEREVDQ